MKDLPEGSSDRDSVSSSSIRDNILFPSLRKNNNTSSNNNSHSNKAKSPLHTDTQSYASESESESVQNLRNAFGSPLRQPVLKSQYDLVEVDLSDDLPLHSRQNSISPTLSGDAASFDSSIINHIATSVVNKEETGESGRFKYLRLYENLMRSKKKKRQEQTILENQDIPLQDMSGDKASIFDFSQLDDFNKFVKESAVNDEILHRVQEKLPSSAERSQNVLNVVNETDLADNFYAGMEEQGTRHDSKRKFQIKNWKRDRSTSFASKGDLSELYFPPTQSPSSSEDLEADNGEVTRFLQRKLSVRHLQMISFGGTIGVGLFLNSGKAITIAGGFGAMLAFIIVGILVLCTLISFCEIVTFVSVIDGVSGLSSRFIDDAFGFATGWLYFFSFAFGVAGEVVAGVIMLSYYPHLKTGVDAGSTAGFVTLFLLVIVGSNLIHIRVFGEVEYISSFVKVLWALVMIVTMIVLNRGGFPNTPVLGFRYWTRLKSDFDNNIIFGLFRPEFNLHDTGMDPPGTGIGGDKGRFLSLLTAILVVCYAYSGTEIVCIAACEAKNPRKALPSATRRVFWRIIIFYVLSSFIVTLNIYAGDPRLLRYYSGVTAIDSSMFSSNPAILEVGGAHCSVDSRVVAGYGSGAQSPWIVALQSANICGFSAVTNAFLVFFAVSCGNAQLYVASRTMYALALQGKAPKFLARCNKLGIPYNSVLFAGAFGLLAYTCVSESATVVFQNLTSVIASSGIFVWFAMCLTFIRFYYGLKRRPDILDRNDKSYPYKSPFQPYAAIVGAVGTAFILLAMGFVVFLQHEWDTMFFFSSYGSLMVFAAMYVGYRFVRSTSIPSLDKLDFDSGRTEMDRYIWDGGRSYNKRNVKEVIHKWISFLA
ncbi:SPS-sensor component SSY1 [Candida viswanathii]|uniref:SPS-sensor component SSY1 n=1 Tax=Candida viswanathii TaxID=5486 RepID=A0A367XP40_9ASCO|nr:SPS-sensor component SSY1 [Candida viswanathii]